jgi:hypothetical protein
MGYSFLNLYGRVLKVYAIAKKRGAAIGSTFGAIFRADGCVGMIAPQAWSANSATNFLTQFRAEKHDSEPPTARSETPRFETLS